MAFETIRKNTAADKVAEQLLNKIKSGELATGSRLPAQRELATMLGVGRSSVREATNALAVMGYLDVRHGKGTFIRSDQPEKTLSVSQLDAAMRAGSILDLMEARELLECKSAELAAERADTGHILRLREALSRAERSGSDYDDFLRIDLTFHTILAEATGNVVICEMTKLILEKVKDHHSRLRSTLIPSEYREESIASAKEVIVYVARGDGRKAAEWMRIHLNAIRKELKDIIE